MYEYLQCIIWMLYVDIQRITHTYDEYADVEVYVCFLQYFYV